HAAVELVSIEPATGAVGQPMMVRFKPRVPAMVRVVATPPGGTETEVLGPTALGNDEHSVTLPPPAFGGAYIVRLLADAGAGRTAELVLPPPVIGPAPPPPPSPDGALQSRLARASGSDVAAPVASRGKDGNEGMAMALPLASMALAAAAGMGVALWHRRRRQPLPEPAGDVTL
ncbi:MAG: hypothetical protein M3357_02475, partial [Actinomycetota bacterium]|nr:hypothetical protein [Actinomycetota bacterium]